MTDPTPPQPGGSPVDLEAIEQRLWNAENDNDRENGLVNAGVLAFDVLTDLLAALRAEAERAARAEQALSSLVTWSAETSEDGRPCWCPFHNQAREHTDGCELARAYFKEPS